MKKIQNVKSLLAIIVASVFGVGMVHAQTINWTGESLKENFLGNYYIKSFSSNQFLKAKNSNGTFVNVTSPTSATLFTLKYNETTYNAEDYDNEFNISYTESSTKKYVYSDKTTAAWDDSDDAKKCYWNVDKNTSEEKHCYTFNHKQTYITLKFPFVETKNFYMQNSSNTVKYPSKDNVTITDASVNWQFVSEPQMAAVYPTERLASETEITGLKYALVKGNSYSTSYDASKNAWLMKQSLSTTTQAFTISGVNNENYIVEIWAKKEGSGPVKIKANTGYSEELTEELKLYQVEATATSNKITVSFETTGNVDAYFSVKSLTSMDEIAGRSLITWTPEVASNGNYYLKYDVEDPSAYLTAISKVSDDIEKSTLFGVNFSNSTEAYLSFNDLENNKKKYVYLYNGYVRWDTDSIKWVLKKTSDKYSISTGSGRDAIYIKSDGYGIQYSTGNANNMWQFISKTQHDEISATEFAKRSDIKSLGTNVRAYWQSAIYTSWLNDYWYAYNDVSAKGKYNQFKVTGLKRGYYIVEVEARISRGDAKITASGSSGTTESRSLTENLVTYYLPVAVKTGNITVYVNSSKATGGTWSVVKSIKRVDTDGADYGEDDEYIKNAHFAIPTSNVSWSNNWSVENFERGIAGFEYIDGSSSLGYEESGIYAVKRNIGWDSKGAVIQEVTLPAGLYTLSADVVSSNCKNQLFVLDANGNSVDSLELNDDVTTKTNKSLSVIIPVNGKYTIGYKYYEGYGSGVSAVDNFRMIRSDIEDNGVADVYIGNAYFAVPGIDEEMSWSDKWDVENYKVAVGGNGYDGNGFYALKKGIGWQVSSTPSNIYQKVTLPAGVYTFSADVVSWNCESELYVLDSEGNVVNSLVCSDLSTKTNKSFTIMVTSSEYTIGYKFKEVTGWNGDVISAVDNFRMVRQTIQDKGIADAYLTNAYFAIPQGQRTWDYGWDNDGFSPAFCGGENGLEGYGLCAEKTGCNNNDSKTHRISQVVNLSEGTYVLSADVIAKDRLGHIYAKVGDEVFDTYCYGDESHYTLEFNIPEGSGSKDVEIGFYSDTEEANGVKPTFGNDVIYRVAVDNFRLISSNELLTNADFLDDWNHWAHAEDPTISIVGDASNGKSVQTATVWVPNGNYIAANDINQTVSLPAGAYQLSANGITNDVTTCLYAKIGDRMQRMYVPSSKWQTTNPQFTFIVPTASDVKVGISFDKTYGNPSVRVNYFHLIRIGDAEGTDITSQIVNANLLANNDGLPSDKYGWRTGTGKDFRTYDGATNLAEVFYNANGSTPDYETYTITQKISGLPDGWYRLTAQGFYRDGAGKTGAGTSNASSTFGFDDPDQARAHLIIGNYYTPIQSLYSENASGSDDNGRPFDMTQARAAFDQGYYNNNSVVGKAVNGVLEIGVRREDAIDHDWLCLDNFKLYYLYEENAFPNVSGMLRNPSFEENSTDGWGLENTNNVNYSVIEMPSDEYRAIFDQDYLLHVTNKNSKLSNTATIGQTVSDLPAGEYTVKVQVASKDAKVVLTVNSGAQTANSTKNATSGLSWTWLTTIIDVEQGQDLGITLSSSLPKSGYFIADNFVLEKTGGDVYVYNCEAGAFISTAVNKGLSKNPVSFSTTGTKLKMSARGVAEGTSSFEYNNQYLNVSNIVNGNSRYEYLTYETSANAAHKEFKVTTPEGSNISTICVNPADATFGTTANIVNAGSASAYNGKYGTTYMGWTGETGFDVVYPLIPENDKAGRGTKWRVLDESQYNKYKNTIAAAHDARMAAWPIYCSARRSTYSVDVTRFEDVYNNISSTAEAINKVAKELKNQLESELLLNNATVDDYVDVTYKVANIDFKEATLANWNNESGKFAYSENTNHVTGKIFGGRHYAAVSNSSLGTAKFNLTMSDLKAGRYSVSMRVSAYAGGDDVTGVTAVAGDGNTFRSVGFGSKTYDIYDVTVPRFTVDSIQKDAVVMVGVDLNGTNAKSVEIGNIVLRYLGPTNSVTSDYDFTNEGRVLKFFGTWPVDVEAQEYFDYAIGSNKKSACAVYLKDKGFATKFDMTFDANNFDNKNLLIYKKPGQENIHILNMTSNIVEGDECDEYVLVDKNDISIPEAFTAKNASYTRSVSSNKYGTLSLPFDFTVDDGTKLYNFDGFEAKDGSFIVALKPVESVEAGQPCIFKKADGASTLNINAVDVMISDAVPGTIEANGFKFIGAFDKHTFGDPTGKDKTAASDYYYIAQDQFWHATDYFTNNAFRAYIYAGSKRIEDLGLSEVRSIRFYEYVDEEPKEETTAIENADGERTIVGYYTLNGQQIETPTSGVVIIKYSDGKFHKVMVK